MGGIELMIGILAEPNQDLQLLATESLANLAKFKVVQIEYRLSSTNTHETTSDIPKD